MIWQLVIFDCDGVLVDSEPVSNRVMAEALTESGLPMTLEDCYRHFMGRSTADCIRIVAERFHHRLAPEFADELGRRTLAALRSDVEPVGVEAGIAAGMTVFAYAALGDADRLARAGARVFTDMRRLPALLEQH